MFKLRFRVCVDFLMDLEYYLDFLNQLSNFYLFFAKLPDFHLYNTYDYVLKTCIIPRF